jgi:hypothetical protein
MKLPDSAYNKTTVFGSVIAIVTLFIILVLFLFSAFAPSGNPYLGIFTFMILPGVLIFGLILIPIGMYFRAKKLKLQKEVPAEKWMIIDLNNRRHRNAVMIFAVGTIIFFILSGIGSYEAYHYTESVEFCGLTCHKVMEPEYTTYQKSTHARVACAECHVGSGASWYVKSKISGLYQVYSVIFHKYPQPIPTPITSLRPARETCEKCHWPQKFYPHKLVYEKHFLSDEKNTEWNINLSLKTGPSHDSKGLSEGIHWHINPNVKIEYIASSKRDTIPWVRYVNLATGDTTIYKDPENPIDEQGMKVASTRLMDCMDCHTRPSHNYLTPQRFIDNAMAGGDVPTDLPQIKKVTMDILKDSYSTLDTAEQVIKSTIDNFYKANYPDIASSKQAMVDQAVKGTINGYKQNIFPYMKASWDAYPDQIGHLVYNGCFRCHNGTHVSDKGKTISKDCNLCHDILTQGRADSLQYTTIDKALEFRHPVDIKDTWKTSLCSECHRNLYQ